ncbi:hypothetical protein L195_g039491 [Trifolium pratense]|uniref:Uncharacterized protein n=1 Tax=Trifolium pratense TaxID=57577 RepID=A0A2K3LY43_TRIPR|nr:hypothetical protein L195_g039491 [Trifolium pratense]
MSHIDAQEEPFETHMLAEEVECWCSEVEQCEAKRGSFSRGQQLRRDKWGRQFTVSGVRDLHVIEGSTINYNVVGVEAFEGEEFESGLRPEIRVAQQKGVCFRWWRCFGSRQLDSKIESRRIRSCEVASCVWFLSESPEDVSNVPSKGVEREAEKVDDVLRDYDFRLNCHLGKANVVAYESGRKSLCESALVTKEIEMIEQFRDQSLVCGENTNNVR